MVDRKESDLTGIQEACIKAFNMIFYRVRLITGKQKFNFGLNLVKILQVVRSLLNNIFVT